MADLDEILSRYGRSSDQPDATGTAFDQWHRFANTDQDRLFGGRPQAQPDPRFTGWRGGVNAGLAVVDRGLGGIPSSLSGLLTGSWLPGHEGIKPMMEEHFKNAANYGVPREVLNALEVPNPANLVSSAGPAIAKAAGAIADHAPMLAAVPVLASAKADSAAAKAYKDSFLPDTYYHGSNRIDRVVEKGKLDPKRATSGPMPFFSSDPAVSSNYATGKMDTSIFDAGDVASYFTVSPKDLGHTRSRTPYTVEQSWNFLPQEKRSEIIAKAKRVGYENPQEATGPYTLHPAGVDATLSSDHFDYLMKTSARGNPLKALREMWHDGGNLVGNEHEMADIWNLAGYPHSISQTTAPWTANPGVMPVKLRMLNPLVTTNNAELSEKVIPALKEAFSRDRTRLKEYGADAWDKNTRWTPKEWVSELERNVADGVNGYVWTSIPDKVTDALKGLGYDGILDKGGKGGGKDHSVAIPFRPNQVRSVNAKFDPMKADSDNLLHAMPPIAIGATAAASGALRWPDEIVKRDN